jgi:hypothetical protein
VRTKPIVLAVALCALVPTACGGGSQSSSQQPSSAQPETKMPTTQKTVGAPGAKVAFETPKNGAPESSTVKAKVKVTGFKLSPNTVGQKAKQGEGHLHFSLDDGKFDQPKYSGKNGQLAVKLGVNGKYSPSVTPTITYKDVPPGKHTLEVYLANNDHSNTGVEASTTFTVKGGASSSPGGGADGGAGAGY